MINYAEKDEVTSGRKHYSYKVQVHWALNALNAFFCHPPTTISFPDNYYKKYSCEQTLHLGGPAHAALFSWDTALEFLLLG